MENIHTLIRKQVDEQSCVQLEPELRRYVDQINEFRELQQRPSSKQDQPDFDEYGNSGKSKRSVQTFPESNSPICTSEEIRDKFHAISELVRSYDKLSAENKKRASDVKAYLQKHLGLLDDLQSYVRTKRQTDDYGLRRGAKRVWPTSEKYEALVRTAAFIRKNALMGGQVDTVREDSNFGAFNDKDNIT